MKSKNIKIPEISDFEALYFLGDAHLGQAKSGNDEERKRKLFKFGEGIARPENHLFIMGDLFDFWFEWRRVVPKRHFEVLSEIRKWAEAGLKLYYLAGNHDFRLGGFLGDEIGFRTYDKEFDFQAGGKKFHLFHGDGIMKFDAGYRFLKRVFRNKFNQQLFLLFHPDWGMKLADWSSRTSRESRVERKEYRFTKDYIEYARKKIVGESFDYVIMGHTHIPVCEKIAGGIYLNIGNWYRDFTYGVYKNEKIELKWFSEKIDET